MNIGNYNDSAERIKLKDSEKEPSPLALPHFYLPKYSPTVFLVQITHGLLFLYYTVVFSVLASNSYMHFKMERDGKYIDYLTPRDSSNQDHLSQNNQNK